MTSDTPQDPSSPKPSTGPPAQERPSERWRLDLGKLAMDLSADEMTLSAIRRRTLKTIHPWLGSGVTCFFAIHFSRHALEIVETLSGHDTEEVGRLCHQVFEDGLFEAAPTAKLAFRHDTFRSWRLRWTPVCAGPDSALYFLWAHRHDEENTVWAEEPFPVGAVRSALSIMKGRYRGEHAGAALEEKSGTSEKMALQTELERERRALQSASNKIEAAMEYAARMSQLAAEAQTSKDRRLSRILDEIESPLEVIEELIATEHRGHENLTFDETRSRIHALIETLRAVLKEGREELHPSPPRNDIPPEQFKLRGPLRASIELIRARFGQQAASIPTDTWDALDQDVRGDPVRLQTILLNMSDVTMALAPHSVPELHAEITHQTATHVYFRFEIRLKGFRFTHETICKVFAEDTGELPNFSDPKRREKSLWLSRLMAEKTGGVMGADNHSDQTARLWMTCPFPRAEPAQTLYPPGSAPSLTTLLRKLDQPVRILLVDEPTGESDRLIKTLNKSGATAIRIDEGEELLRRVRRDEADLIIVDFERFREKGFDLVERLRSDPQDTSRKIPIIGLAPKAIPGDRTRFIAAGMDDYMAKPVAPSQLLEKTLLWSRRDHPPSPLKTLSLKEKVDPTTHPPQSPLWPGAQKGEIKSLSYNELLRRCMGSAELARRLIGRFTEKLDYELKSLREAWRASDHEALLVSVNRLRGAAANLAANGLRDKFALLENAVEEKQDNKIDELIGALMDEARKFHEEVERFVMDTPPKDGDT